jgi:hypothetical protein
MAYRNAQLGVMTVTKEMAVMNHTMLSQKYGWFRVPMQPITNPKKDQEGSVMLYTDIVPVTECAAIMACVQQPSIQAI